MKKRTYKFTHESYLLFIIPDAPEALLFASCPKGIFWAPRPPIFWPLRAFKAAAAAKLKRFLKIA